ncbi:MAG: hypothetical protein L6R37_007086 [Teloschistes peruensis]|nr:MAG: hypothetical protein L6R37_007086 [Teloschistes peruensis]
MYPILSTFGYALKTAALEATALIGIGICGLAAARLWHTFKPHRARPAGPILCCSPGSRRAPRRAKKQVRLDMEKNTTHTYTPVVANFVAFHWHKNWIDIDHEPDPAGYNTLHCERI